MSFRESLNLKKLAKEQLSTLDYWFRSKYKLSPKDPRYLECKPWEIELEYEIDQVLEEEVKSRQELCPKCNGIVVNKVCQICGMNVSTEKYHDPDFDEYFDNIMKESEEFFGNIKWEEVPDEVQ